MMELGQKLKQARLEAGMTQRALCGDRITRNMLSQIENGSASPSMGTLEYLAGRLGKSPGFFLDPEGQISPNQGIMESARRLYDSGEYSRALVVLEAFQEPDPVYSREMRMIRMTALLELARQAIRQDKQPYAQKLLEKAADTVPYCGQELERQRLLLLGSIPGNPIAERLPSLDPELLIRAEEALQGGDPARAGALLEAAEDHSAVCWLWLRGETWLGLGDYCRAAACYHRIEDAMPRLVLPRLEQCYRELEDYKQAYAYACRQKG